MTPEQQATSRSPGGDAAQLVSLGQAPAALPAGMPDHHNARGSEPLAARLLALTAALSVAATPSDVAEAVVREATAAFGATGTVIARVVPDRRELEIMQAGAMPSDILDTWRRFPLDMPVPLADVARTGVPLFLESRDDWIARYPDSVGLLDTTGHQSHMVAPLVVEGAPIGALGVTFDHPRRLSQVDRTLVLAIATQCALALERARLFDREREARAEAEQARAAAEEARARADEANEAKTRFLTTMSHELRTPLNAIAGYTELLAMEVYGPLTPGQSDALQRISRSQRHLLGLITDVLDFARIDADSLSITLSAVPITDVLTDVETFVAPQMRAKHIESSFQCGASVVAHADGERLRQIVLNLVGNAVKFTPEYGRIAVDGQSDGSRVSIRVHDSGIGIPSADRESVFEPFVQLGRGLTTTHQGTGLGLAISRELARLMGGDIVIDNVSGQGTAFVLTLPAVASQGASGSDSL